MLITFTLFHSPYFSLHLQDLVMNTTLLQHLETRLGHVYSWPTLILRQLFLEAPSPDP
jgi:hypothetical protein